MTAPRRWIRLDVGWDRSDWLVDLPAGGKLGWVLLLGYVKAFGVSGRCKAMTVKGASREWGVPEIEVQVLLDAAVRHGALDVSPDGWFVTKWSEYQEPDRTAAERMRRYRADKSRLSPLRRNTVTDSNVTPVTGGDGVTCHATETLTLTVTEKKTPKRTSWRICPDDWQPSDKHRDLAGQLHVTLDREVTAFREWEFKDPKTDADKAFSRWLRTAAERASTNGNGKHGPATPSERQARNPGILRIPTS